MNFYFIFLLLTCLAFIDAKRHSKNSYATSNEDNSLQPEKLRNHETHSFSQRSKHNKNHHKTKYLIKSHLSRNLSSKDLFENLLFPRTDKKCGYNSCDGRKEGKINVHIVNHSHDDVGWLKTVDQYYYGNKNNIQRAGVQYIVSSVIEQLKKDPKRKFIFVEIAFFKMWWDHQDNETKLLVKQLVDEGRFEFISGGWSMNDEAAAHYISIIDQMTLGHQWLLETFGSCAVPKIGWQIDPFVSHSREQASLFAQMGFDALFFGRLDYRDKRERDMEKKLQMIWRGSDDLGKESDLFTGVLPDGYNPPGGFCFDDTCADEAIVDDKRSPDYNVERRVQEYVNVIQDQTRYYKTKDLIHTMGSDFQYQNAVPWYTNLDRLIYYVNKMHPEINVFYSTPTCYLKGLHDANITWPTKNQSDFFPYASDPHAYWTGYFTSRPAFKGLERWASGHLQSARHLQVLADLTNSEHDQLRDQLKEALGVSQHHDAITGTEKQHVYSDYVLTLNRGIEAADQLIAKSLNKIYNTSNYSPQLVEHDVEFCRKLNVSECEISEQQNKFLVHIYNPIAHQIKHLVRLPVKNIKNQKDVVLRNSKGNEITFDIVDIAEHIKKLPERKSEATKELVFLAELNATSLATFSIDLTNASTNEIQEKSEDSKVSISSQELVGLGFKLYVNETTGQPQKVILDNGKEIKFEHEFKYYIGAVGDNNKWENRSSGAYVFRPNGTIQSFNQQNKIAPIFIKTEKSVEIHTSSSDFISNTLRVHKDLPYIEFDYVVGPIPIEDNKGKEIVSIYKTDLSTNGEIYTDANGRQLLKRVRNSRPDYQYDYKDEPASSNYYPLNSKVELRDEKKQLRLAVLLDRSQGGASLNDGELELMVHRRLLHDDAFGVGEALNEPGLNPGQKGDGLIIRGVHRILINSLNKDEETLFTVSEMAARQALQPMIALRKLSENVNTKEIYVKTQEESILKDSLPKCINLLTLESYAHYKLIRFEHLYGKMDQDKCSDQTIEIDLYQIFDKKFRVNVFGETTLTVNQGKGSKRLDWRSDFNDLDNTSELFKRESESDSIHYSTTPPSDSNRLDKVNFTFSSKIKIKPTEIKTYLIFLENRVAEETE